MATCLRCGKECATGNTLCSECMAWKQSQLKGTSANLLGKSATSVPKSATRHNNHSENGITNVEAQSSPNVSEICPNCGAQLLDGAEFCVSCGEKILLNPTVKQEQGGPKKKPVIPIAIASFFLVIAVIAVLLFGKNIQHDDAITIQSEASAETDEAIAQEFPNPTEEAAKLPIEEHSDGEITPRPSDNYDYTIPFTAASEEIVSEEPAVTPVPSDALVRDHIGLLTESQVRTLEQEAQSIENEYGCSVYILIVDSTESMTRREFAKQYYQDNDLGRGDWKNGILFMVAMESREYVTITYGRDPNNPMQYGIGINAFTDELVNELEEQIVPHLSNGNYFEAFSEYLSISRSDLQLYVETEGGIHRYSFVVDDCTWNQAFQKAQQSGGYLVRINSKEELSYLISQIEAQGLEKIQFRIGGRRDDNSYDYYWVDQYNQTYGEILNNTSYWGNSTWLSGEPSYYDSNLDINENCMCMYLNSDVGGWIWNDVPDDLVAAVSYYAGKVGYIVEYEN